MLFRSHCEARRGPTHIAGPPKPKYRRFSLDSKTRAIGKPKMVPATGTGPTAHGQVKAELAALEGRWSLEVRARPRLSKSEKTGLGGQQRSQWIRNRSRSAEAQQTRNSCQTAPIAEAASNSHLHDPIIADALSLLLRIRQHPARPVALL